MTGEKSPLNEFKYRGYEFILLIQMMRRAEFEGSGMREDWIYSQSIPQPELPHAYTDESLPSSWEYLPNTILSLVNYGLLNARIRRKNVMHHVRLEHFEEADKEFLKVLNSRIMNSLSQYSSRLKT